MKFIVSLDKNMSVLEDSADERSRVDVGYLKSCCSKLTPIHFQGTSYIRLDIIYVSVPIFNILTTYTVTPLSFCDHCLRAAEIGKHEPARKEFM